MNNTVSTSGSKGMSNITNFLKKLSTPTIDATGKKNYQNQMMMAAALLVLVFLVYNFVIKPYMNRKKKENFTANSDSDSDDDTDTNKEN